MVMAAGKVKMAMGITVNPDKLEQESWDLEIKPQKGVLDIDLAAIWRYRDLLLMFVKRDVVTVYKQTILGPLWYFIQPILTTIVYMVVFAGIAGISTDGVPPVLFYSSGIVIWNFFSETLTTTSRTFIDNTGIFGKVYFPRIILPLSKVISGLLKFFIQFGFFLVILFVYMFQGEVMPNWYVLWLPVLIALMSGLAFGTGIIFTSLTRKYRDLNFLIVFGVQLMMYATPVVYPVSSVPEKYRIYIMLNPVTHIVEAFKYAFLNTGSWSVEGLLYSTAFTIVIVVAGFLVFTRTERTFMDVV